MKLREKFRRFWTMDVHNHEGFTLVELIIVIAILAILSGVAVVGYSSYVEKASKQADKTLVAEIANALTLHYYSNIETAASDYVILTPNGASTTTSDDDTKLGFAEAALVGAYGENWEEVLSLKYNGWTDDDLLALVAEYDEETLALIAGSTFLTTSTPDGLMSAVTDMTGLVTNVIAESDLSKANERLALLLGADSDTVETLNGFGMDPEKDEEYSTVVSNMLVTYLADTVQNTDGDNNLTTIMFLYSTAFAYAEATGDTSVVEHINGKLDTIPFDTLNSDNCLPYIEDGLEDVTGWDAYVDFAADNEETDVAALMSMMGAVGAISSTYNDKESLSNPNLFISDAVSEQVNNYVNSVKALAGMKDADRVALQNLPKGAVVIFIDASGVVTVTPISAWIEP